MMNTEEGSLEDEDEMLLDKSMTQVVEESKLGNFNGPLNEILRQRFKSQKVDLSKMR